MLRVMQTMEPLLQVCVNHYGNANTFSVAEESSAIRQLYRKIKCYVKRLLFSDMCNLALMMETVKNLLNLGKILRNYTTKHPRRVFFVTATGRNLNVKGT